MALPEKEFVRQRFEKVKERHRETYERACAEGAMDEGMKSICQFISKTKNYFTSSGCCGRILLLGVAKEERKKEAYFHRRWHRKVELKEVLEALQEPSMGEVWLKMEAYIIHLGCKSLEDAKKILRAMELAGVRRGGIRVAKKGKFIVEAVGSQELSMPVKRENDILVEDAYLKEAVKSANRKMDKNKEAFKRFDEQCRKLLK